jgi:RNA-directed DNA polymerase
VLLGRREKDTGRSKGLSVMDGIEYNLPDYRREHNSALSWAADVRWVSGCEIIYRTFTDGKARDVDKDGAPIGYARLWKSIYWKFIQGKVRRLQIRIAKAIKDNRWNKARALQYLLSRSLSAKLWAVKRVTSNRGKKTPGIDGMIWKSHKDKINAALSLKRRGYNPQPLRRIYILKKNGKKRPLSIPTMYDRAMQALYKQALAPLAETTADKNSYGFREARSCADAISAAFNALCKPNSATWVLEADIKGCFDNISTQWITDNVPMDKHILARWLAAGYSENGVAFPTRKGTPQGGIISPTLANMTLDGLEERIHKSVPRRSRVNFVRYADDFIVTAKSRRLLTENVRPVIEVFLFERGLSLSLEKTVITHITDGFTFLGQTFRKNGNTLRIKPSKEGTLSLIERIRTIIRKYINASIPTMISKLNETLRGWANYHKHVVSHKVFKWVDEYLYRQLWRGLKRLHSNKSARWIANKYWKIGGDGRFAFKTLTAAGKPVIYRLVRLSGIGIVRHRKIIAEANPYMPEYAGYFYNRRHDRQMKSLKGFNSREMRLHYGYDNYGSFTGRVSPQQRPSLMPEPYEGKLSRTVLRGESG